jgi:ubiquinone/menaquinone biosynthesis C-methylase UbiE
MVQKLQRNFDVIRFLIKNANSEQLAWRKNRTGWSLGETMRHLRNLELWHTGIKPLRRDGQDPLRLFEIELNVDLSPEIYFNSGYRRAFEEYAGYRRQIIELLQQVPAEQWQYEVTHPLFGQMTLAGLVEKIDEQDQAHIRQIEEIIQAMPLNPLLNRALYEISDYHTCYRAYLAEASSLLDIGVGPGLALRHVMRHHPRLTFAGVDVRDLRLAGIDVPLQVYDGHALPFSENQFDISLLFYVLHHCQNWNQVLDEAVRVTRRNLIIIEEFSLPDADETSLDLTERQNHQALGIPTDLPYQVFDQTEFEAMLQARNLSMIEQQPLPSETARPVQKYLYVVATNH